MRRRLSLGLALLLAASSIAGGVVGAGPAGAGSVTVPPKTVTRDLLTEGVTKTVVDSRTVSLSVNETSNLRGLQQIEVSWTGAHPTGGNVSDPNSVDATSLEYPMVLLECRGIDSSTAPAGQQLSPDTCWTSSPRQRYAQDLGNDWAFPPWRVDLYAAPSQRTAFVGVDPQHYPGACSLYLGGSDAQYWLPLTAANGHVYPGGPNGCAGQPPEAVQNLGDLTFPSNETFAVTAPDGGGSSKFVVHTSDQNASLGCSDTVACSLVAIPIMGISCDVAALGLPPEDRPPTSTLSDPSDPSSPTVNVAALAQTDCTRSGHLPTGAGSGGDDAVSGVFWWAASNWRNRISVPLNFAPVGDACSTTGKNGGVDIYGSELLVEATTQWNPHFCANSQLFTLKHVQTGEPQARFGLEKNLQQLKGASDTVPPGGVEAAFATYLPPDTYSTPVVSAPVALTGFAIAFSMDDASRHEITHLNINARLLAKLLTESYPSSRSLKATYATTAGGVASTVLRGNPLDMAEDPEFQVLNPSAPHSTSYLWAASTLYSLSADSDVMYALTSYIANDPEASAWLAGAADPWGMRVNPHYQTQNKEISLPTGSWRLLDPVPDAASTDFDAAHCSDLAKVPYLPLVAAAASSLAKIALAMQFSSPLSTSACKDISGGLPNPIWAPARVGREGPGTRFMLGVTSLGEANRYQLNTASLQTQIAPGTPTATPFSSAAGRTFVTPSDASLQAAAKLLVPDTASGTWQLPQDAVRTTPGGAGAYPGTMVVSAQVPTLGLPSTDASRYAQFLRFAAGDGQNPGTGIGQLPPGYLPMTAANGLGALASYTRVAADAVEAQSGDVPSIVPGGPAPSPSPSGSSSGFPLTSAGANGPSATSTASGGGSSGSPGPFTALGPSVSGSRIGGAQPPVDAPGGAAAAVLGAIGKTLGIVSRVAGSILWWLVSVALGALAGAGVFWAVARRRGVKLGLKGLIGAIREWLLTVAGRRRARGSR